jgi:Protein of unknown function (DUF3592)
MDKNIGMILFGLFALLFGNLTFQNWYSHHRSKRWPKTSGQIAESSVSFSSLRKIYSLAVRYTYAVKGKRYVSNRFDFYGHGYTSEREAMSQLLPYSVGSKVTVYYDPKEPWNAVLNRHVPVGVYFIYLLMTAGMLVPIITELRSSWMNAAIK